MSDEVPTQAASLRLDLLVALSDQHPKLAWDLFSTNVDAVMAPFGAFAAVYLSARVPERFWLALPPDALEAWFKAKMPAEMAPQLGSLMETVRFKHAEQARMRSAADAAVSARVAAQ
jgi:aminopeptidase N